MTHKYTNITNAALAQSNIATIAYSSTPEQRNAEIPLALTRLFQLSEDINAKLNALESSLASVLSPEAGKQCLGPVESRPSPVTGLGISIEDTSQGLRAASARISDLLARLEL